MRQVELELLSKCFFRVHEMIAKMTVKNLIGLVAPASTSLVSPGPLN
jgi:hypothetical protein